MNESLAALLNPKNLPQVNRDNRMSAVDANSLCPSAMSNIDSINLKIVTGFVYSKDVNEELVELMQQHLELTMRKY